MALNTDIDTKTGAPPSVRAAVGSVTKISDRLAILRQYYPDAQADPVDPGNFIYTEPKTGRVTLYNPKGLDKGDAASVAPEIGEVIGGAVGAVRGAAAGAPAGPVGAIAGGVAGAGAGATTGNEIASRGVRWFAGAQDPRTVGQQVGDAAITGGVNMLGEGAGRAVIAAVPGLRNFAFDRVGQLMDKFGIPGTLGQRTGSPGLMGVEAAVAQAPLGGAVPDTWQAGREAAGQTMNRTAVDTLPSGLAPGSALPAGAGGRASIIGPAIVAASERHAASAKQTVADISRDAAATGAKVDATAVRKLRAELVARLEQADQSLAPSLNASIKEADKIIADVEKNGGLDFRAALAVRRQLGEQKTDVAPGGIRPMDKAALDQLYGAWRDDIYAGAAAADAAATAAGQPSPSIARRLQTHDANITSLRDPALGGEQTILERLAKTYGTKGMAGALDTRALLTQPNETRALLAGLEINGEKGAATQLRASLLNEIGRGKPGSQNAAGDAFSFQTLLTNYDNARQSGTLDAIFPKTGSTATTRQSLDDMAAIAGRMRDAESRRNTPNTGGTLASLGLIGGVGGGAYTLAETGNAGTLGTVLAAAAAPWVTARLLTSPRFARWLTQSLDPADSRIAHNLPGHLGRLAGMEFEDEAARGDRDDLIKALSENPTFGPLMKPPAKPEKRSEAAPEQLPVPPGLMGGPPPTSLAAGPPALPPGLMGPDPSAAASQYAANAADPGGGLPPGLLTQDPEAILRAMLAGGAGAAG